MGWAMIIVLGVITPEVPIWPKLAVLGVFTLCVPLWDAVFRALRRMGRDCRERRAP